MKKNSMTNYLLLVEIFQRKPTTIVQYEQETRFLFKIEENENRLTLHKNFLDTDVNPLIVHI